MKANRESRCMPMIRWIEKKAATIRLEMVNDQQQQRRRRHGWPLNLHKIVLVFFFDAGLAIFVVEIGDNERNEKEKLSCDGGFLRQKRIETCRKQHDCCKTEQTRLYQPFDY